MRRPVSSSRNTSFSLSALNFVGILRYRYPGCGDARRAPGCRCAALRANVKRGSGRAIASRPRRADFCRAHFLQIGARVWVARAAQVISLSFAANYLAHVFLSPSFERCDFRNRLVRSVVLVEQRKFALPAAKNRPQVRRHNGANFCRHERVKVIGAAHRFSS